MAQNIPLRVISLVRELIVTTPPHEKGPILGRPTSSRARFQAVMERHPLRRIAVKVPPQSHQLVR